MATQGRPPGLPKVPGSGRKRGSLDKSARLLLTDRMAADILKVYKRLGPDWLFKVAQDRPDLFINQCLSRLLPPAIKEDPDFQLNQQFNIGELSDMEAGRRVAFALAKAAHDQGIDISSQAPAAPREPDRPPLIHPEPVEDPALTQWASELPLTPAERADQKLIRETKQATIESYAGSPSEQGGGAVHSSHSVERDPRASARDRILARRRDKLL